MNTRKGLINPVLHEIRSPNPPSTRVSELKYQNNYPKSIEGMAGVGYNRNSNDLRALNQKAKTTAIGARQNPDYSKNRFTGLYGQAALNQPQKYTSDFDLRMKQEIENLRHGNENRRFGKRKTMKKSSYENGMTGGGYSGEIIVTPKRGRPYKGQPNSLPLVSKRQKIRKDDYLTPYRNANALNASGYYKDDKFENDKNVGMSFEPDNPLLKKIRFAINNAPLIHASGGISPILPLLLQTLDQESLANSTKAWSYDKLISLLTSPFMSVMAPHVISTVAGKTALGVGARIVGDVVNPAQDLYGWESSVQNLKDAIGKEIQYQTNGSPHFNPAIKQNFQNQPITRFNSFGNTANDQTDYMYNSSDSMRDMVDLYNQYITAGLQAAAVTAYNIYQKNKNKPNSEIDQYLESLTPAQKNFLNDNSILYQNYQKKPKSQIDQYLESLTPAERNEFGRFGVPTMTRKTVNIPTALQEAFASQYTGAGTLYPKWSNHGNENFFDTIDNLFGDLGSNRGVAEAPQYYIEGFTPQGIKRKRGVSYVRQPTGENMPPYELNSPSIIQHSDNPLLDTGMEIANKYLNQIQNGKMPDFSPVRSTELESAYDLTEDPGWYSGVQIRNPVPKVKENLLDQFSNWTHSNPLKNKVKESGLDFSKNPFSKRNTKKSATFTKSLSPIIQRKYDDSKENLPKLVNTIKNTNKYFK